MDPKHHPSLEVACHLLIEPKRLEYDSMIFFTPKVLEELLSQRLSILVITIIIDGCILTLKESKLFIVAILVFKKVLCVIEISSDDFNRRAPVFTLKYFILA